MCRSRLLAKDLGGTLVAARRSSGSVDVLDGQLASLGQGDLHVQNGVDSDSDGVLARVVRNALDASSARGLGERVVDAVSGGTGVGKSDRALAVGPWA